MRPSKSKRPAKRKKSVRRQRRPHATTAMALSRLSDPVKRLSLEPAEDVVRRPRRAKRAAPRSQLLHTQECGNPVAPGRGLLEQLRPAQVEDDASSKEVEPKAPIVSASDANVFESMFASQMQLIATLLRLPPQLLLRQQTLLAQLVFNYHYPQKAK